MVLKNVYMQLHLKPGVLEAGIDEAGRGSLMGRLYVGAVIFPPDVQLDPKLVKDSKKFTSHKKRLEAREYILKNCLSYGVAYAEADQIDRVGIVPSVIQTMHKAISALEVIPEHILVDGNYFEPYFHPLKPGFEAVDHTCVVDGDAKYFSIAAGSILAKVAHDEHIAELVERHPVLREYGIHKNMGYGSKEHTSKIQEKGITPFHRKSYGICRDRTVVQVA